MNSGTIGAEQARDGERTDDLLEAVIAAHGGRARWQTVHALRIHLHVRGNILAARWQSPCLQRLLVVAETRRVRAVLRPFPRPGLVGVFEGDTVRIETELGRTVRWRDHARSSARRRLLWDDLDRLYFFGYAFWNYANTPFLFTWPGFQTRELAPDAAPEGRGCPRRLQVTFPPTVPTHCPEQTFYFDEAGLLRRLDYTADVFGPLARGAHLCEAHREFSGLVLPTHRKVVPRWGNRTLPGPAAMEGWLEGVEVIDE